MAFRFRIGRDGGDDQECGGRQKERQKSQWLDPVEKEHEGRRQDQDGVGSREYRQGDLPLPGAPGPAAIIAPGDDPLHAEDRERHRGDVGHHGAGHA